MADGAFEAMARQDFDRAHVKGIMARILGVLRNEKDELLSLDDVRSMLKPTGETYRGMRAVPIDAVVGSEGRYRDFNSEFLPRRRHLRSRWERIDVAHYRSITLPPITLYKVGTVYFVRDGNHRVSVARTKGVEFVDAEVTELSSQVNVEPGMTTEDLKREVIELEKKQFLETTGLEKLRSDYIPVFTAPGRYVELIRHIHGHKYYLNLHSDEEILFEDAMLSWYDNVFSPIIGIVRDEGVLARFPGRTEADLYVWTVRHWDELKRKYGQSFPLRAAVRDFGERHGVPFWRRLFDALCIVCGRLKRNRDHMDS